MTSKKSSLYKTYEGQRGQRIDKMALSKITEALFIDEVSSLSSSLSLYKTYEGREDRGSIEKRTLSWRSLRILYDTL